MSIHLRTFLDQLVDMEELAYNFYLSLARMVKDEKAKMVLSYMALEELKHRDYFLSWKASGGDSIIFPEGDLDLTQLLKVPDVNLNACRNQEECLDLAIRLEEASIRLYRWLANLQPERKERDILEKIIAEEENHKKQYEDLR
jgi:rubrerythrin